MENLSKQELRAYVAGFYEGEGTIVCSLQARKNVPDYPHITIQIPQNYIEPLLIVVEWFGCGVIDEKRGGVNYVYRIQGYNKCREFIGGIYPLLSTRRQAQADDKLGVARNQIDLLAEYKKTCKYGHDMTRGSNIYADTNGVRCCRECRKNYNRAYRQRKKIEQQS